MYYRGRLSITRVREIQIQERLLAILRLVSDFLTVWSPGNPNNQQIGRLIFVCIDPTRRAAAGIDDSKLNNRVWITSFGIRSDFQLLVILYVVADSHLSHRPSIHPPITD